MQTDFMIIFAASRAIIVFRLFYLWSKLVFDYLNGFREFLTQCGVSARLSIELVHFY